MCVRNMDWLSLTHASTGDQICNPGICPDRESNGDRESNHLLCWTTPNQLSHASRGLGETLSDSKGKDFFKISYEPE